MQVKVRRIGSGYGVLLPKQVLDDLAIKEGTVLTLARTQNVLTLTPQDEEFTRQVDAFLATETQYAPVYRELAK